MPDLEPHSMEEPTTPRESVEGASAARVAPPVPTPSVGSQRRRLRTTIIAAVALLLALASGSVFAAQSMVGRAVLAPEASLNSAIHSGAQARSQSSGGVTSVMSAACHCSSHRASFIAPPFQPTGAGQVVIVSIGKQELWAYQNGQLVMTSLVTTGMPQLPTPTGTYHIMMKEANVWFYSPWPYGSPYYYSPEHINYAMLFRSGGFYIHDAPWRETFGPGTNVPHTEPDGTQATGSHGCVNMPTTTASQLYAWIGIGATVVIQY